MVDVLVIRVVFLRGRREVMSLGEPLGHEDHAFSPMPRLRRRLLDNADLGLGQPQPIFTRGALTGRSALIAHEEQGFGGAMCQVECSCNHCAIDV